MSSILHTDLRGRLDLNADGKWFIVDERDGHTYFLADILAKCRDKNVQIDWKLTDKEPATDAD